MDSDELHPTQIISSTLEKGRRQILYPCDVCACLLFLYMFSIYSDVLAVHNSVYTYMHIHTLDAPLSQRTLNVERAYACACMAACSICMCRWRLSEIATKRTRTLYTNLRWDDVKLCATQHASRRFVDEQFGGRIQNQQCTAAGADDADGRGTTLITRNMTMKHTPI